MYKLKESKTVKAVAGLVGLVTAVMMMGPSVASAQTASELQAQIAALMAQINALNAQISATTGSGSCAYTFATNLKQGQTGADVMNLQKVLNMSADTQVSTSGAGAPGSESTYFGAKTKAAVIKFQNKYKAEILTPIGLTSGTGVVGAATRAKLNTMCSGSGPVTTPTTGGLTVMAASQPVNSLAPQGASRVPFTTFTIANNSGSAVTVTGVTVERTGLASDSVFSGLVLVDSNNVQIGIAKTLNSNHQAVVGDTFTLNPGESKTLTVAGNMLSSGMSSYAGQVVSISVVGISTTATVSGSLPINGAMHTINASLSIGSVSTTTSAYDPGTTQTKNLGDTAVKFSGVKFTASSVENIKLYSVRWRQTGTASASDLSNVMTYVDGTAYPTTVSSDGKYYTTVFSGGISIEKGFSKDVYIQGDVTGSGAAGRTVNFDIDKGSDVYFVGQTYGYGIPVSGSYSPWYDGYQTTVNAGTATAITKANEVPAQNIAVNVPNVPLGGFATEFKGEPVSVQSLTFTIATSSAGTGLITGIALYDANGAVVAGPADATFAASGQTVTLSNTVTFPSSRAVYTLKGKLPSTFSNNGTIIVSTVVNSTNWTNATGQTSGNTITLPGNTVAMNTMTIKAGAVTISVSPTPTSQTVVSGVNGFTVANYQIDATQSGEDIRFTNFKVDYDETSLSTGDPINCFLYDGSTRLNSTAVTPTTTGTEYAATFDTALVVAKGTLKTIALKCDLPASLTTGSFAFGILGTSGVTSFTGTGVLSGQTITPSATTNAGSTMTITSGGSLAVTKDSSSPAYAVATAGSSNVTLGVLRVAATNEDIRLDTIALQLTSASSSPSDLTEVSIWDGATKLGTTVFAGTSDNATTTLTVPVTVPANTHKLLTVKGNLASIGTALVGTQGSLLKVNFDGTDSTGTRGTGLSSGTALYATGSDTDFDGVRVFKSYPTFAQLSVPSTTLVSGTGVELSRFSVKASAAGGIGIGKFTINVATSTTNNAVSGTTTVTNLKVYAYTDAGFSSPVAGFTDGQVVSTIANLVTGDNDAVIASPSEVNIPTDTTYYFKVTGDITLTAGTGTFSGYVTTKVVGDSAYLVNVNTLVDTLANVDGQANDNLIWSPNATTTSETTHSDWTNGYFVPGLPSAGLSGSTLSK